MVKWCPIPTQSCRSANCRRVITATEDKSANTTCKKRNHTIQENLQVPFENVSVPSEISKISFGDRFYTNTSLILPVLRFIVKNMLFN